MSVTAVAALIGCSSSGESLQPPSTSAFASTRVLSHVATFAPRDPIALTPSSELPPRTSARVAPFVDDVALAASSYRLAVSDDANDVIDIYTDAGKKSAVLTGLNVPEGLATDASGRLFVADTDANRLLVYPASLHGKPTVIPDPGNYPSDVAVAANGAIAAANIASASGGGPSISFYDKNGKPGKTLTNPAFARIFFCAFDRAGDLIVDGSDANNAFVAGEVAGGENGKKLETLAISNTIKFGGGILVDAKGHILISDQENAVVYLYDPPKNGALSEIGATPLTSAFDLITFALSPDGKTIWDADANLHLVNAFPYPAGGAATKSIAIAGQPIGIVTLAR